jgi:hypothetical protein
VCCCIYFLVLQTQIHSTGHVTATNACSKDTFPLILKIEIWVYSADDQKVTGVQGETDNKGDFSLDAETEFDADHWKLDKVLDKDGHYICFAFNCTEAMKCNDVADNSKKYTMTEKGYIKIECNCK